MIFLLANCTDIADGYIARTFNMITKVGKALDPLADKLLSFTTITMLAFKGRLHYIIPILLFTKEILIGIGGLVLYKKRDFVKGASWYGKFATFIFFLAILLVMFEKTLKIGRIIVWIALAFSFLVLVLYFFQFLRIMKTNKKDELG